MEYEHPLKTLDRIVKQAMEYAEQISKNMPKEIEPLTDEQREELQAKIKAHQERPRYS